MAGIYRRRHPEHTVFYRVFFYYFEWFLREYEDRFEKEHGYFRPVIREVVEKYLDCGNPMCGFARIRCPDCGEERLLMFSCKTRGFCPLLCPSCGGTMTIVSFIEDHRVVDRIIRHLELTFEAERPPPPTHVQQDLLMAVGERGKYF